MAEFKVSPTASVEQGGFSSEKGGNLRDHNGCCADSKAIAATVHYDGDYGTKPAKATTQPTTTPDLHAIIKAGLPPAPIKRDVGDRRPKFTYVGGGTRG